MAPTGTTSPSLTKSYQRILRQATKRHKDLSAASRDKCDCCKMEESERKKMEGQKLEHSWGLFWRLCFQNAESGLPLPKSLPQSTGRSGVSHRTYFLRKGKQMPFSLSGLVPQSSGLSSNFVVTPCDVFAALVRNCSAKLPPFGISAKRWKRWAASRLPGQEN